MTSCSVLLEIVRCGISSGTNIVEQHNRIFDPEADR